ncbi:truncated hemoglobin [Agrobacterium tumefaciens]|jgi:hemoglobin|uniref:group III truncated hemoglobin n=1 Tax=Rhizobium/Agrobacterium group TaxID=227290 RepID=UPI0009D05C1F|nr:MULTISPECIES: truncated hemoglobin [Rhizobium/Agrobacterium group]KAA3530635.1 globin [Agrobacterium tumefaciens]MDH7806921.1 hemoglobin [Rhizobium sp. AN67]MDQ4408195.1 truncated hemoglobin [Rhizobium sp. AN63]NSZ61644.1 truncated hemoglobin [Agrobacterium tumefaciens]NTA08977.1 truncated hemoglobin [Agrobacterium tumefaciens]
MQDQIAAKAAHNAEIQNRAEKAMAAIGIDAGFVDLLVETFYGRVLEHPTLGPVFDARLSGRWPEHMARMKQFWAAVAFKNGGYGGKPVQAHLGVKGMSAELFPQWLALFSATLDDIAPSPQAHSWFMETAERIAKSLTLSLFYNPAMDDPALKRMHP